jgi:hypothetical protein
MLQLSFACLAVKERFKILNKHVKLDFQSWDQITSQNQDLEKKLSEIILLHERLGFAITLINKTFTTQMILSAAYTLLTNVLSSYMVLHEVIYSSESYQFISLPSILWISVNVGIFSYMIDVAVTTTNEVPLKTL